MKNEARYTSDIAILYLKSDTHPSWLPIKSVTQDDKLYWEKTKLMVCGYPG